MIASISARVGSVGDNSIGGWHSYRASKTALNQLNKCMSIEFARKKQNIACIVLHPGTVDTDLSKPFQKVGLSADFMLVQAPSLVNKCSSRHDCNIFLAHWMAAGRYAGQFEGKQCSHCQTTPLRFSLATGVRVWDAYFTYMSVQNVQPEKLFSKERAVRQLLDIMDNATAEDSGRFIAWDGQPIPW